MKYLPLVLLLSTLGCSEPFRPETPHPSAERMQELLNAPVVVPKGKALTFHLEATPAIALLGNPVTFTCYIPESLGRPAAVRIDIDGEMSITEDLDGITKTITTRPSCGTHTAQCAVATYLGVKTTTTDLEVKGGLCDDSGDSK